MQLSHKYKELYYNNPILFIKNILNSTVWDKQAEICNSVNKYTHTSIQSAYGTGKSFILPRIALWYLYTRIPSKIIMTSSSFVQVEKILFGELANAYNKATVPLGGRLLNTDLILEKDWFCVGISPKIESGSDAAVRAEGFHSPNIMVIIDQAQGVNPKLWETMSALISNDDCRIVAAGNPIAQSGKFFEACVGKTGLWNNIKISAFDTPNVVENKNVIPGLVTRKWVDDRKSEWGEDSPLYKSKVLAEFPPESDDIIISLAWAEIAIGASLSDEGPKGLGVDVARFGEDETVLVYKQGQKVKEIVAYNGKDLMGTVGQILKAMERWHIPAHCVAIDDSGLGGGVVDRLHEEGHRVIPVNNGSKPDNPDKFFNKGSELYWDMRALFESEAIDIPDNGKLVSQLVGRRYEINSAGKIKLESKDAMKKRGMKSPDYADALALAVHGQKLYNKPHSGPSCMVMTW